jgi:hypothetical protein
LTGGLVLTHPLQTSNPDNHYEKLQKLQKIHNSPVFVNATNHQFKEVCPKMYKSTRSYKLLALMNTDSFLILAKGNSDILTDIKKLNEEYDYNELDEFAQSEIDCLSDEVPDGLEGYMDVDGVPVGGWAPVSDDDDEEMKCFKNRRKIRKKIARTNSDECLNIENLALSTQAVLQNQHDNRMMKIRHQQKINQRQQEIEIDNSFEDSQCNQNSQDTQDSSLFWDNSQQINDERLVEMVMSGNFNPSLDISRRIYELIEQNKTVALEVKNLASVLFSCYNYLTNTLLKISKSQPPPHPTTPTLTHKKFQNITYLLESISKIFYKFITLNINNFYDNLEDEEFIEEVNLVHFDLDDFRILGEKLLLVKKIYYHCCEGFYRKVDLNLGSTASRCLAVKTDSIKIHNINLPLKVQFKIKNPINPHSVQVGHKFCKFLPETSNLLNFCISKIFMLKSKSERHIQELPILKDDFNIPGPKTLVKYYELDYLQLLKTNNQLDFLASIHSVYSVSDNSSSKSMSAPCVGP